MELLIALIFGLGVGGWVYGNIMKRTGGQTKTALTAAAAVGVVAVIVFFTLFTAFVPK